jgi:hypothetical protein
LRGKINRVLDALIIRAERDALYGKKIPRVHLYAPTTYAKQNT